MSKFYISCEGTAPLLMHNARLVDPLDMVVKKIREVSTKTKKTDEDHEEIAKLEWLGGIYYDPSLGPYVPTLNLHRCLVEGARRTRAARLSELCRTHVPIPRFLWVGCGR